MRCLHRSLSAALSLSLLLGPLAPALRAVDEDLHFANPPVYYDAALFGQGTIEAPHGYDPYGGHFVEEIPRSFTPATPAPAPAPAPVGGAPAPVHTVVRGDTLWGLSSRYCGSGSDWRSIYEANRDRIQDPHWIYPGQQFVIACPGSAPAKGPAGKPGATPAPKPGAGSNSGSNDGSLSTNPLAPGSYRVTSEFGPRTPPRTAGGNRGSSNHQGIDLGAPQGTPIRAAGAGTVEVASWRGGYGYAVYIRHPNGWVTRYGHMARRPDVRPGQRVEAGQTIGVVGSTGNSSGPHLHFETRRPDGTAVDPRSVMRF